MSSEFPNGKSSLYLATFKHRMVLELSKEPPLIQAIMRGDVEAVRAIILKNADVNYQDSEKRTPLHCAAFVGSAAISEALILSGAKVKAKDSKWLTPLHVACFRHHDDVVEMLLRHDADANARDKNWQTPLHIAASQNATKCVEFLLTFVSNVNVADRAGRTALHHAAFKGNVEMCDLLIERQANLNVSDKKDRRAIHWASLAGHLEIVRKLALRAECRVADRNGNTPLHAAATGGHQQVIESLIAAPSMGDVQSALNTQNDTGNTALHIAALNGQDLCVQTLICRGADTELRNAAAQTALHLAACSPGGALCLKALLDAQSTPPAPRVDVNAQQADGNTSLHLAAAYGLHQRANVLIQRGAVSDLRNRAGQTPLHVAAKFGHPECVRTLLLAAADPFSRTSLPHGATPLHLAALYGHIECVRLLLDSMASASPSTPSSPLRLTDENGNTPLHAACVAGRVEILQMMLSTGASVRALNKARRTPLHILTICAGGINPVSNRRLLRSFDGVPVSSPTPDNSSSRNARISRSDADRIANCATLLLTAAEREASTCASGRGLVNEPDVAGCTPLHYAAAFSTPYEAAPRELHSPLLDTLVRKSQHAQNVVPDPTVRDVNGLLPLHYAAMSGHAVNLAHVLALLDASLLAAIFAPVPDGSPPPTWSVLHFAAASGSPELMRTALRQVRDPAVLDCVNDQRSGRTPLHIAALCGNAECCAALLERGACRTRCDAVFRQSAAHLAAAFGHAHVLRVLLRDDPRPLANAPDQHGRTSLMLAAQGGHADCVDVLLAAQADPRAADVYGRTALHRAAACGFLPIVQRLVDAVRLPSMTDVRDFRGITALHLAAAGGHADTLRFLLARTRMPCTFDRRGYSPLHFAAFHDNVDCFELLLDELDQRKYLLVYGERPDSTQPAQDNLADTLASVRFRGNAFSPLHCMAQSGAVQCALTLLQRIPSSLAQALTNAPDRRGRTSLHVAAFCDRTDVLRALLAFGADPTLHDATGRTPALLAALGNAVGALTLLLDSDPLRSATQSALDESSLSDPLRDVGIFAVDASRNSLLHASCAVESPNAATLVLNKLDTAVAAAVQDGDARRLIVERFVNAPNADGKSALHVAAASGNILATHTLIERGANVFAFDARGNLPVASCAPNERVAHTISILVQAMLTATGSLGANNRVSQTLAESLSRSGLLEAQSTSISQRGDEDENQSRSRLSNTTVSSATLPNRFNVHPNNASNSNSSLLDVHAESRSSAESSKLHFSTNDEHDALCSSASEH